MEQLSGLGKVTDRSQSTDDVTGQVTDLEGRITTLKASIVRLQGFLSKASDAGEIGTLESELLRRETELEGIQGQLRTIEAQVAESTVTLTITEPGTRIEPIEETDDGVGFMDGLTRGWEAFTAVVNAIVVALAAIAPFFGIGLLVWLVVRVARRRRGAADADSSTCRTPPHRTTERVNSESECGGVMTGNSVAGWGDRCSDNSFDGRWTWPPSWSRSPAPSDRYADADRAARDNRPAGSPGG
jgi:hypothetical protein